MALLVAVCVGVAMRVGNLTATNHGPDERNYTYQAASVLQQERAAFPVLIAAFHRDIGLPPPTRAGFLYLLAGVMAVTGRTDLMAGIWLSCAASVISLLLVAWIGWRFLGPMAAVIATVFYAVSSLPLFSTTLNSRSKAEPAATSPRGCETTICVVGVGAGVGPSTVR